MKALRSNRITKRIFLVVFSFLFIITGKPRLSRWGTNRKVYKALFSILEVVGVVVKLRCPYCGYVWDYRGKKTRYVTCPNCMRKVDIQKNRVE